MKTVYLSEKFPKTDYAEFHKIKTLGSRQYNIVQNIVKLLYRLGNNDNVSPDNSD